MQLKFYVHPSELLSLLLGETNYLLEVASTPELIPGAVEVLFDVREYEFKLNGTRWTIRKK